MTARRPRTRSDTSGRRTSPHTATVSAPSRRPRGALYRSISTAKRPTGMSGVVQHHVLDVGVVLTGVDRQVLAVPGLLVAAVRHLGHDRDVVVDPDAAELERLRDAHRAADVLRPHR